MRKRIFLLATVVVLGTVSACSPGEQPLPEDSKEAKGFEAMIPEGWSLFMQEEPVMVKGDLNQDGIDDVAAVIEEAVGSADGESPSRSLLIAFGDGENGYTPSILAEHVILRADEGGVWGDPFESIEIDRGSVVVRHYGGSNWRWFHNYRFRFQDNDWYLIGATLGEYFTGNATEEEAQEQDYNLLTGDYTLKETLENGETRITNGNRGKEDLIRLQDFNSREMDF